MGKNHLLVAVALAGANLLAWYEKGVVGSSAAVVFLFGTALGVLLPDVDAEDARIFHGIGIRWLRKLDPVFMAAGRLTKMVVYFPTRVFWRGEHRGIMHSLAGLVVSGVFWTAVFLFLKGVANELVFLAAPGIVSGYLIHLVEDSFTRSGVAWLKPFSSRRVRGQAVTGRASEDLVVIGFLAVAAGIYFVGKTLSAQAVVFLPLLSLGLVLVYFFAINPLLWFLRFIPGFS